MFCPECGAKLEEGAAFCTQCGTKIESENADASVQSTATAPLHPEQSTAKQDDLFTTAAAPIVPPESPLTAGKAATSKKTSKHTPLIILGIVSASILIALCVIFFVFPRFTGKAPLKGSDGSASGSLASSHTKSQKKTKKSSTHKKKSDTKPKKKNDKKASTLPRKDASDSKQTATTDAQTEYATYSRWYADMGSLDQRISAAADSFNQNFQSSDMSYRHQLANEAKLIQVDAATLQAEVSNALQNTAEGPLKASLHDKYTILTNDLYERIDVILRAWDLANSYGSSAQYHVEEIKAVLRSVYDSSNRNKYKVEFDSLYPHSAPTPPAD